MVGRAETGWETKEPTALSSGGIDAMDAERGEKQTPTPGTVGMGDLYKEDESP